MLATELTEIQQIVHPAERARAAWTLAAQLTTAPVWQLTSRLPAGMPLVRVPLRRLSRRHLPTKQYACPAMLGAAREGVT